MSLLQEQLPEEQEHSVVQEATQTTIDAAVNAVTTVKNFVYQKKQSISNYMTEKKVPETTSYYYEVCKDKLYHLFTDHPRSKGLSYWQHFYGSMIYFLYSFGASLSFLLHSMFPFMLEARGSQLTSCLHERLMNEGIITTKQDGNLVSVKPHVMDGCEEINLTTNPTTNPTTNLTANVEANENQKEKANLGTFPTISEPPINNEEIDNSFLTF
jgi:hypothetical protein